jgi:hypothetical protein
MFKTYKTRCIPEFVKKRDVYPENLPEPIEKILIGIESLLVYGHVKHALEHALMYLHDSPNGMTTSYTWDANTFKLFNKKVYESFYDRSEYALYLLEKMLHDPEAAWTKLAIFSLVLTIKGDKDYIGNDWMNPTLNDNEAFNLMLS